MKKYIKLYEEFVDDLDIEELVEPTQIAKPKEAIFIQGWNVY